MKVLITGGCGFIGSAVVRRFLSAGYDVHVLDILSYSGFREHISDLNVNFIKEDLRKKEKIKNIFNKYGPYNLVVHVAAESSVDKSINNFDDFITTNILGSSYLFEACMHSNVPKIINFCTDEIYGHFVTAEGSFTESSPILPRNLYSASKAAQFLFANAFKETHNLPIINVCPSNCFGPRQLPEKLLPRALYLMMNNKSVPVYGNGLNVREWLYVEDLADAILLLSENGKIGETYNVGSDNEKSNLDVLHILEKASGFKLNIQFIEDRKGHDFRYSVDSSKIKKLGWAPQRSMELALSETVEWYRNNKKWFSSAYQNIWKEE